MGRENEDRKQDIAPEGAVIPRPFDIFYSSGVFGENTANTELAIDELVRSLGPQERLTVAAAIRKIVRQHSEEALRRVEDRMRLAQEVGRIGCFEIDMRDGTSVGTPAFFELYGLPGDQGAWSQQEWLSFIHPDDRPGVIAHLKEVALGAEMTMIEYRVVRTDGKIRWTTSRARVEKDEDGRQVRAYGIQQDITERKLAELALAESNEHHRHFIEVNPASFWTADAKGKIRVANSSAADRFGIPLDVTSAVGAPPLLHEEDRGRVLAAWRHSLATGTTYDVEHRMRWADGEYRWVHTRAYPRLDPKGDVVAWYGATEDINERKLAEQRLSWLATHDSLTGLGNRLRFGNLLQRELDLARGARQGALLLLDLDGFKQVNDVHGHDVGDAVLIETGRRLQEIVGPSGLISRLGGDEFTVIIPHLMDEAWLEEVLDRLVLELAQPIVTAGVLLTTRASIGVAVYPQDDSTVSRLLKNADLALYAAKSRGRGCWTRFEPKLRDEARRS